VEREKCEERLVRRRRREVEWKERVFIGWGRRSGLGPSLLVSVQHLGGCWAACN
jgi:hypothetical protein